MDNLLSLLQVQELVEARLGRRVTDHKMRDALREQTPAARYPNVRLYEPAVVAVVTALIERRAERAARYAAARAAAVA